MKQHTHLKHFFFKTQMALLMENTFITHTYNLVLLNHLQNTKFFFFFNQGPNKDLIGVSLKFTMKIRENNLSSLV